MQDQIDAHPQQQRRGVEQDRQDHDDNDGDNLHLQHAHLGPRDQPDDDPNSDE